MKKFKFLPVFCALILILGMLTQPMAAAVSTSAAADASASPDTANSQSSTDGEKATASDPQESDNADAEPSDNAGKDTTNEDAPKTSSKEIVLMDADTGVVLYSKDADQKTYPASLTKIMTVLLAVEAIERGDVSADDVVTCASDIRFDMIEDGSTANIAPGEKMTLKQLMYCALVSSANEACNAIAEYIGGTIKDYIVLMNSRADELGCTGTHFANTHGLPNSDHYTTAEDFARISHEAYKHKLFMEICNTPKITIPATNMSEARELSNTNGLINADSEMYRGYTYPYAVGIKTGHTDAAGYCLISSATKNDINLICVIMGGKAIDDATGTKYSNFTDTIKIYDWAFEYFSYREILKTTDIVAETPVLHGKDADTVMLRPKDSLSVLIPTNITLQDFEQKIDIYSQDSGEALSAPVEAGQTLGKMEIVRNGVSYGTVELVASQTVELSYGSVLQQKILDMFKNPVVDIFIVLIIALIVTYIVIKSKYNRAKKQRVKQQRKRATQQRQARQAPQQTAGRHTQQAARQRQLYDQEHDYYDDFNRK